MLYKRIGNRHIFFNKYSFCLKGKLRKYVTLGTNCFPRTKLTKFGIKAKKADGELSYPFDLCFIPLKSVSDILQNDFIDYYDGLTFDNDKNIWTNKKYDIFYWHDKNIDFENFKIRYNNRIENFKSILSSVENINFISVIFNEDYDENLYKTVFNSLAKYCAGDFKYLIVNIKSNPKAKDLFKIANNIYYKELKEPCENYKERWTDGNIDKIVPNMYAFYEQYVDTVIELDYL